MIHPYPTRSGKLSPYMGDLLYQEKFIEIEYDRKEHWLYVTWNGQQTFESIQKGGHLILKYMVQQNCCKILNDNRLVRGTWTFAAEWTREVWFPAMVESGLKHFAWIFSPDAFARFAAERSVKKNPGILKKFDSFEEAQTWLRSV